MDTVDFLRFVLPEDGFYVGAILASSDEGSFFRHHYTETIEELDDFVQNAAGRGQNVYYAVASFQTKTSRKGSNVSELKLLVADIDCGKGKPYATPKEALPDLTGFIKEYKLPNPTIVSSGNGLHVYWVFEESVTFDEWKPVAESLKMAMIEYGVQIDPVVTGDASRVLRPIGTVNPKGNKPVRLLKQSPVTTLDFMRSKLPTAAKSRVDLGVPTQVPDHIKERTSGLTEAMGSGTEFAPSDGPTVRIKCKQIGWGADNPQEVDEPFWYNMLGVAAFCHAPEKIAIEWSDGHPDFTPERTLEKLYQWKNNSTGPSTCDQFAQKRPSGCKGCPYKDKIGSPARLGIQAKEVAVDEPLLEDTKILPLPKPFKRTSQGIKVIIDGVDIDVCPFDIYPVSYGKDEGLGYEVVRFHWNRPHMGWQELILRQAFLAEGAREFSATIADQGIVLYNKRQTEMFQLMLRSYMNSLREKQAMTNLYASMGWKDDFTQFVIGNTLYRRQPDGKVTEESIASTTSSNTLADMYTTSGSLSSWTQYTSLLSKGKMPWHMFALGVGFSSVFYAFTGLKGLTVSLYGPTGGGKTLIQYWIQSLYGNPDKLHFAAKFTQNTLFSRMGTYAHMPMTIDEVTLMQDKDVADFIYWVSQGRDKARLDRHAQERESKSWAMPVLLSTNRSFNSKIVASGLDSDAQMMRLLELTVEPHKMFTKDSNGGRKVYEFLMANYGLAGREFIKKLLAIGPEGIQAMIAEATAAFPEKYGVKFSGEERFWEQSVILADLALTLAYEWELIMFPAEDAIEWVLEQLGHLRINIMENQIDSFDVLSNFINDNSAAAISVMHIGVAKPMFDVNRLPRSDVRIRFDLHKKNPVDPFDSGTMLIDRSFLRSWLGTNGVDYKRFLAELEADGAMVKMPANKRVYLGKDTPIKLGQSYVVGMNLNHARLRGILTDADDVADNLVFGKLGSITGGKHE
jgi:hypothetical protein